MEKTFQSNSEHQNLTSVLPPATGSSNLNVGASERIISVLGGAALTFWGMKKFPRANSISLTLAGGYLLARGVSGYCPVSSLLNRNTYNKKARAMEITGTFTINRPRAEVYSYWRNLENLPRFMKHLEEVVAIDDKRSTWKARIPGGVGTIRWEAEIIEDQENDYICWCSLPHSTLDNAGEIRFSDAPGNRGTEIHATISYRLPAGDAGSIVGKLFNPLVEQLVKEDLRRFKNIMETGEIPTTEGQPSGRARDIEKAEERQKEAKQNHYESAMLERY